jgi:hypothetical protein
MKAFAGKTQYYQEGMDLRDYFAAKVIQGIVANSAFESIEGMLNSTQVAYMIADAMMEARQTPNNVRENTNG